MAQVLLESVSKLYGETLAVDSVDLAIDDGEFVVLVGPSGCGKSTTLRMVAGLEEASEGTISIGGAVVNEVPPAQRDIAMVFQSYALYPHMTVRQNMSFGLMRRRRFPSLVRRMFSSYYRRAAREEAAEMERFVDHAADLLGITDLLGRRPGELSGGQRQRVALGRAIVRKPKAFLFDEPLSNLDAKLRVEMRTEIRRLHRKLGATTIYVTHDQEEAMTLGDRLVVMKDGVIQQVGTPAEVYEQPANQFVASFVGTPPMNLLPGPLFGEREGIVVGVRPDAFRAVSEGEDGLRAKVATVERLGDRTDYYLNIAGESAVWRAPAATRHREGDSLHLIPERTVRFADDGSV